MKTNKSEKLGYAIFLSIISYFIIGFLYMYSSDTYIYFSILCGVLAIIFPVVMFVVFALGKDNGFGSAYGFMILYYPLAPIIFYYLITIITSKLSKKIDSQHLSEKEKRALQWKYNYCFNHLDSKCAKCCLEDKYMACSEREEEFKDYLSSLE